MVWTAGAGGNVDVIYVEGWVIDCGGDGLYFEVVVIDIVGGQGGVLDGVVYEEG